jgi:hypothetical protein
MRRAVGSPKQDNIFGRCVVSDQERSRAARQLAERALVRLVREYGEVPEFVLLGGLVPDLLCSGATHRHIGTIDVDVQVDLEIQGGTVNGARLEAALTAVGFHPDTQKVWRWRDESAPGMVVKIEFLADLDDVQNELTVSFDQCDALGAVNLRGTGFAAKDWALTTITTDVGSEPVSVEVRVATLPAYLLAKIHAAHGRGLEKDWYDIAYVLLHNDEGGPGVAARRVVEQFGEALVGATETALSELAANFTDGGAQGSVAYATTMQAMHPEMDLDVLANDGVAAVSLFLKDLLSTSDSQ